MINLRLLLAGVAGIKRARSYEQLILQSVLIINTLFYETFSSFDTSRTFNS